MNYLKFFDNNKTFENRNMHEICIMIVSCNCCMLFELSCESGPCTPILSTGNIPGLVFLCLAAGQIEQTWVQNGPLGFENNMAY